ncbi:MAG TPA: hypothetical protein VGK04_06535 [Thermoanaerobaculia bacterium]
MNFDKTTNMQRLFLMAAIALAAFLFSASANADTEIARAWSAAPPAIDGVVSPGEWTAGTLTNLTHAKMRTMNDAAFLYVLLDVVDDTHDDPPAHGGPGTGDSFVFAIDVDQNHAVTPNVDFNYDSCNDGRPFIKDYYLSTFTFTGCQTVAAATQGAIGFGMTPGFAFNHRFWEFRFSFAEIGVDPSTWTTSSGTTPNVRANVATVSEIPAFTTAQPDPSLFPAFGNPLFQIDLATTPVYPLGTDGPVFAGVGLVPSTFIEASGVATINIPNYYSAKDAPFGGKLNVFGHWNSLSALPGAKKYRVVYSKDGGPWTRLLQTWTNFKFVAGNWVPISVGPDGDDAYVIPDPVEIWYLPNLLISWQSGLFPNGTYALKLEILNNGGGLLASPAGNSLTLFVDNTPPVPTINQVYYDGTPLCDCAIVTQGDAPRGFTFDISVTDANGALNGFSLGGVYGNNLSTPTLYSDAYSPAHVDADGANRWNGVTNIIVPVTPFRASTSCAYTYTLSASSRVQNGYGRLFTNVQYHFSFTTLLGSGAGSMSCP